MAGIRVSSVWSCFKVWNKDGTTLVLVTKARVNNSSGNKLSVNSVRSIEVTVFSSQELFPSIWGRGGGARHEPRSKFTHPNWDPSSCLHSHLVFSSLSSLIIKEFGPGVLPFWEFGHVGGKVHATVRAVVSIGTRM